jgi:pimeloyl-ACP methyl ester carboxylesterase
VTPDWLDRCEYPSSPTGSTWALADCITWTRGRARLLWGTRDPAFGACLSRWCTVFEQATVVELDCGHAPPEERPAESLAALERFLAA